MYSNSWEDEDFSVNYEDAQWQIQQLEKKIHKLKKKKRGKKLNSSEKARG